MDSKEILEELKCPICFDIPDDKIFLCQNGHPICDGCSANLQICPQCRVSFGQIKVRNRTLEILLDTFKFDCAYKELGCQDKVGRKEFKSHIFNCPLSGNHIKLCNEIGFKDCKYLTNILDISASFEHYKNEHEFIVRDDLHFQVHLSSFNKAGNNITGNSLRSMWIPMIIDHASPSQNAKESTSRSNILLLSLFHEQDKSISWMCVKLSSDPKDQKYYAYFEIKSLKSEAADLSWRISSIDLGQMGSMLPSSPFRIPAELLRQFYIQKDGSLTLTVKLVPMKGKNVIALNHEASILKFICFDDQPVAGASSKDGGTFRDGASHNVACDDCGLNPIVGCQYLKLQGMQYSLCGKCVRDDTHSGQPFAVIRNSGEEEKHINNLWVELVLKILTCHGIECGPDDVRNEDFAIELVSSINFPKSCSTANCILPAVSMCLRCEFKPMIAYCEECMAKQCPDHICAMIIQRQ